MSFGLMALLLAVVGAGWLLWRVARGGVENKTVGIMKIIVWFGLAAALLAVKLWPLALMVLLAAGGVAGIEIWRAQTMKTEAREDAQLHKKTMFMDRQEALSVLGVAETASVEDIKNAHKKLIAQIHPDKGGTDYLASKINEARDVLIRTSLVSHDNSR